jgi:molybdopterin-binding protein
MAEMKFSTGNQIQGKIMEIRKGAVTAIVYVAIPGDVTLESSVTSPRSRRSSSMRARRSSS